MTPGEPAGLNTEVRAETVAGGLQNPWGMAFLPDGSVLVTERPGRLRRILANGTVGAPVSGLPAVDTGGQGGLLGIAADSGFATNRTLYLCYSEAGAGGTNGTAMASARLSADNAALTDVRVLFRQTPKIASDAHFGCRIVEQGNTLFLTLGDRLSERDQAQQMDSHLGKVVRVNKDGTIPTDNPFVATAGALPEIWSLGHRNVQGAALHPATGALWTAEHGPQGGDELNLTQRGLNYGWPVITYGVEYGSGAPIGEGTSKPGMEQPLAYWVPSIAPSGLAFLTSGNYGSSWRGNLFMGALAGQHLVRMELDGTSVVRQTRLLTGLNARIRDVQQGPDGLLYVLTDASNGQLLRLAAVNVN